jgi:hypothetical protein
MDEGRRERGAGNEQRTNMFTDLWNLVFGCHHSNYSFPMSGKPGRRSSAAAETGAYVVCLDCGKEFAYDWREMKVLKQQRHGGKPLAEAVEPLPAK